MRQAQNRRARDVQRAALPGVLSQHKVSGMPYGSKSITLIASEGNDVFAPFLVRIARTRKLPDCGLRRVCTEDKPILKLHRQVNGRTGGFSRRMNRPVSAAHSRRCHALTRRIAGPGPVREEVVAVSIGHCLQLAVQPQLANQVLDVIAHG